MTLLADVQKAASTGTRRRASRPVALLTATLLLIPTGTQTLATQFWSYETNLSYSQAAPFALVMMVVAAGPSYLLGRFFQCPAVTRG